MIVFDDVQSGRTTIIFDGSAWWDVPNFKDGWRSRTPISLEKLGCYVLRAHHPNHLHDEIRRLGITQQPGAGASGGAAS